MHDEGIEIAIAIDIAEGIAAPLEVSKFLLATVAEESLDTALNSTLIDVHPVRVVLATGDEGIEITVAVEITQRHPRNVACSDLLATVDQRSRLLPLLPTLVEEDAGHAGERADEEGIEIAVPIQISQCHRRCGVIAG